MFKYTSEIYVTAFLLKTACSGISMKQAKHCGQKWKFITVAVWKLQSVEINNFLK